MLVPLGRLFASVEELSVIRVPFSFYKIIAINKTGYIRIFRYVCKIWPARKYLITASMGS